MAFPMYGEKGIELIKVLLRDDSDSIPPFNNEIVEKVLEEMIQLNAEIQKFVLTKSERTSETQSYDSLLLATQLRYSALLWNKRCLLSYHNERLLRIKRLRWEFGSKLPNYVRENLSESEHQWFADYCQNLSDYMSRLNDGKGIDLTLHKKPPKRLFIQVRCVTDYGDFELDDGTSVIFSKDSMHYLPLSQCEKLIHQGILEQIT